MALYERWHKSRPRPGDPVCREHGKVPTADHGRGGQWQVRWRDESGAQRKRDFARKATAASFDAEIRTRLDRGTSLDLAGGRQAVRDYAWKWRDSLAVRPATAERLSRVFSAHVDGLTLGGMAIVSVRPSHIRAWAKDRAEVLAPSTLAVIWANVASMFNAAVLDRLIGVSPFTGLKPPAVPRHEHFIPASSQVHAVIGALPVRYQAAAWLAAGCGWRRNEFLGAELDSVDFLRRTADVRQQLLALSGEPMCLAPPKTATSCRVNELPEVVGLSLARHIELYVPTEQLIWDRTDPRKPVQRMARLLFTTATGAPVHPAWWAKLWRTAADKAGIPSGVGVHCLRHYHASLLIHGGKSVKEVQLAMGHATPMITLNTYAGMWPEDAGSTRSIVDAALGNVPGVCPDREAES
jgi:integrase